MEYCHEHADKTETTQWPTIFSWGSWKCANGKYNRKSHDWKCRTIT